MKIIHLIQRDHPAEGGAMRVAQALVKEQIKNGHTAFLVSLYGEQGVMLSELGSQGRALGVSRTISRLWIGPYALHKLVKELAPDIVHCHDGMIWPRLCMVMLSCKVIWHGHSNFQSKYDRAIWRDHISRTRLAILHQIVKSKIQAWLLRFSVDHLIAISTTVKESWLDGGWPEAKTSQIPNGIDLERFRPAESQEKERLRRQYGIPSEKRIILWIGRFDFVMKRVDFAFKVGSLLRENTAMIVLGDGTGNERQQMLLRYESAINLGRIISIAATDHPENFYRLADYFLFTSYYEPFGLVILEAVASRLPIISLPGRGASQTVQLTSFAPEPGGSRGGHQ